MKNVLFQFQHRKQSRESSANNKYAISAEDNKHIYLINMLLLFAHKNRIIWILFMK